MNDDQALLVRALSRPDHHPSVKLACGKTFRIIPLSEARDLAKRGRYAWAGTRKRVKQISLLPPVFIRCYRTCEAPVLPPSTEWLNSRRAA